MNAKGFAASIAAIAAATTATAGVKYWDNPDFKAFDVGDYVQDGLVLHYDGIRNAGPNAAHDSTATTWKNLGTGGATYDMALGGPGTSSAWGEDGFVFAGDAYFKSASKQTLPEYYEIQTLVDAKASDASGIGYIYTRVFADTWNSSDTAWNSSSIAVRPEWSQIVAGTTYKGSLVFNTHYYTSGRPVVPTSSATIYDYITALGDSTSAAIFTGLEVPAAMPGRASPQSGSWAARNPSYVYLGAHDNGSGVGEAMKGTIKNFRYYSRILSANERAWNRVVDEARYFNRRAALPVTNVVIASNIPIATGDEPVGRYAVDGSYVFSAPATKVVKGRTYTLDGFTVETWNGSAWGAAEPHAGETSYTATDAALVRLTWQWTAGDGLVAYDADDYVQDGLVLHYDGIRNAGLGVPHDAAATTWVNVANPGSGDLARHSLVSGALQEGAATGSWTDDGFVFSKNALFRHAGSFTVPTRYTTQAVFEAKQSEQENIAYVVCPSPDGNAYDWLRWSVGLRIGQFDYGDGNVGNVLFFCAADAAGGRLAERGSSDKVYHYATAMLDVTNAVVFTGTTAPWTASGASYGHRVKTGTSSPLTLTEGFSLAGHYPTTTELLKGTIHDFRFYDRVLSDTEIAWNRSVDEARYFTEPSVVVVSTRVDVQANEPDGEYGVVGSYVFTAPASATNASGIVYAPTGYAVQAWDDAAGVWGAATEYEGESYAYTTAAGKVRLLWRWKAIYGLRTATDYDVSDYVAGGLLFHLDGIRNVGAKVDHAEAPATWVNLGTAGAPANATIRSGDAARVVNWTGKGYRFDGNTRFFATIPYTTTFTLQLCTDAIQNDQHNPDSSHMYPFTTDNKGFAISTYNTRLYFRTQGNEPEYALGFAIDKTRPIGYITAMLDDVTKTARIFPGTSSSAGGSKTYDSMSANKYTNLTLGGGGNGASQFWTGTINYFRYYDRVLSDAELAQNRKVDQARFFGELGVTNVLVAVEEGSGITAVPEPGAYFVEGQYTFTATGPAGLGYKLSVPDDNGGWRALDTIGQGDSFAYDKSAADPPPAFVKLEWRLQKPFVMVIR